MDTVRFRSSVYIFGIIMYVGEGFALTVVTNKRNR